MKKLMLVVAVACAGLFLAAPAQAQSFTIGLGYSSGPSYRGYGGFPGGAPGYGRGFVPQRGHYDVVPGHFVPHRGHSHYVPPHVDYHIGRRSYQVIPTPCGPTLSPVPHRHRHW